MKGLLLYNLPQEQEEFELAQNGWKYKAVLEEIDNRIRNRLKYEEELPPEVYESLAQVRSWIAEELAFNHAKE